MTTLSDPRSGLPNTTQVNYEEPTVKPPPLLVVGPLAWIRNNLFRSTMDTILTLVFAALAISIVAGILTWIIQAANWFAITRNIRLFMVGRFPINESWRVEWLALFVLFVVGFALATWARVSRGLVIGVVIVLAITFVLPPIIFSTTPPPETYLTAGTAEIQSGTVTETPLEYLAFIGQAGDPVSVHVTSASVDEPLAVVSGFADRAATAVINAIKARFRVQGEIATLDARLDTDLLTDAQRETLTADRAELTVPPPVTETLQINQSPFQLQIIDGETQEILAESDGGSVEVVLPHDGWYVLHKVVPVENGVALLEANNIEPVLISELSAIDVRYRSMTRDFETAARRPQLDGSDVPLINIIDNQYLGDRSFAEFLRLHVAPFLDQINLPLLYLSLAAVLGFFASRVLQRFQPRLLPKRRLALRVLSALLLVSPIIAYVLLAAVDASRWGGLLLTMMLTVVGIVASFPIGVLLALGRRSNLPVVKWTSILFIELVRGVPLITVLFIANLMLPLLHPDLVSVEGVVRAMAGITLFSAAYLAENVRGGLQSIPAGQEEAAKAVGLNSLQITVHIMLPQALRAVIPALVGQAISLFKDTSLVAIIGLFDLTRIADSVVAQPEFIGTRPETYLFISIIYFGFSYLMAIISRQIESSGSGAARRF